VSAPRVTLTPSEYYQAAHSGLLHRVQNIRTQRHAPRYGEPRDAWGVSITGAIGEAAVAKYLGVWWLGNVGRIGGRDVAHIEVRSTSHPSGALILHDQDPDDVAFVLVRGDRYEYELPGWLLARDGKRREWWRDPQAGRPAYFVPAEHLHPMRELPHAHPLGSPA
jgi:hypothetical protein